MKMWIKTYVGDKIIDSIIVERKTHFNRELFDDMLREACVRLDLSTPIVLSSHFKHFDQFNSVKFIPRDFIDNVHFDYLLIENASNK